MPDSTANIPTRSDIEATISQPDPVLRNFQITIGYHALAEALAARLGPGSESNWCAFAVWASKQAGHTIRGEDLQRTLRRAISASPDLARAMDALIASARPLGSVISQADVRAALGPILITDKLVRRVADAVGRGNLRVFTEVGSTIVRFLEGTRESESDVGSDTFDWLHPGDPPAGQGYLKRALSRYAALRHEADPKRRAELLLLGNIEIGYHEQVRVQPEIAEATSFAIPEPADVRRRLMDLLFPSGSRWLQIRSAFWRVVGRPAPLDVAMDRLIDELRRELRRVLTQQVMVLDLAGIATLRLGQDLSGPYPELLQRLDDPDLVALLARIHPNPPGFGGSGARDWADVNQRVHYIAELFRRYQGSAELAARPYGSAQIRAVREGRVPPPPH